MNRFTHSIVLALVVSLTFTTSLFAETLKVTSADGETLAEFNQETAEALGLKKIETETPWTEGIVEFEGVPLKRVLIEAGVGDQNVVGLAFDDYAASITIEVIDTYDPIIATRINGKPMSIEDKGPFWIMFDFDDIEEETSIELRSFAVWHLNELEVE